MTWLTFLILKASIIAGLFTALTHCTADCFRYAITDTGPPPAQDLQNNQIALLFNLSGINDSAFTKNKAPAFAEA